MQPIRRLKKGAVPTPMEVDYFNGIVDLLNALIAAQVIPAGSGSIKVGPQNITLDLGPMVSQLGDRLTAAETKISNATTQITQLLNALQGASVTADCQSDGSISITINFPGV
jgi:hypothetical protein